LIYPNKSRVFRNKLARERLYGKASGWIAIDYAILDALKSEWDAAQVGDCR